MPRRFVSPKFLLGKGQITETKTRFILHNSPQRSIKSIIHTFPTTPKAHLGYKTSPSCLRGVSIKDKLSSDSRRDQGSASGPAEDKSNSPTTQRQTGQGVSQLQGAADSEPAGEPQTAEDDKDNMTSCPHYRSRLT